MVEVNRPPITTIASGFCISAPGPLAYTNGIKPNMAVVAVISTLIVDWAEMQPLIL
jgi:hypothetical protein